MQQNLHVAEERASGCVGAGSCAVRDCCMATLCSCETAVAGVRRHSAAQRLSFVAKEVLLEGGRSGGGIVTVIDGVIMASKSLPDGRRQVIGFRFKGDHLMVAAEKSPFPVTVQAITRGTACRVDGAALGQLWRDNPSLVDHLFALSSAAVATAMDCMLRLGRMSAVERVAHFVLEMRRATGRRVGERWEIALPMSRLDIADYLGLELETVSRAFGQLKRSGILALPGRGLVLIYKPDVLGKVACG